MYMYVNKRVELAQRGIALYKFYVLFIKRIAKVLSRQSHVFHDEKRLLS